MHALLSALCYIPFGGMLQGKFAQRREPLCIASNFVRRCCGIEIGYVRALQMVVFRVVRDYSAAHCRSTPSQAVFRATPSGTDVQDCAFYDVVASNFSIGQHQSPVFCRNA